MADQLALNPDHLEALRQRLDAEGTVVFKNRSVIKKKPNSKEGGLVVRWHDRIERGYSMRTLEKAMDYALHGSRRPPPPQVRRDPPHRPACYRSPKQIARELKVAHKEGLLLDIPIPEVPDVKEKVEPVVLPPDQPF